MKYTGSRSSRFEFSNPLQNTPNSKHLNEIKGPEQRNRYTRTCLLELRCISFTQSFKDVVRYWRWFKVSRTTEERQPFNFHASQLSMQASTWFVSICDRCRVLTEETPTFHSCIMERNNQRNPSGTISVRLRMKTGTLLLFGPCA